MNKFTIVFAGLAIALFTFAAYGHFDLQEMGYYIFSSGASRLEGLAHHAAFRAIDGRCPYDAEFHKCWNREFDKEVAIYIQKYR